MAADLHLPGMGGVEFLERAHAPAPARQPGAAGAMDRHGTRIPFSELATLQRATALGRSTSVVKGWVTPEEWLYPQVQEALTAWTMAHGPRHVVYRIVGEQWAPRSHKLRDLLARNGVPFEFSAGRLRSGQQLLRDYGIDARLPAVVLHGGSGAARPSNADFAAAHGSDAATSDDLGLAILGAGPAGLAAAVYGASEGLRTSLSKPGPSAARPAQAPLIRNYLGFPRGVSGGALAHQAWEQAVLFGAQFVFTEATQPQPRATTLR